VALRPTLSEGLPLSGSQLKKVFSSDIGVEPSSQVLDILYSMPVG